MLAASGTAGVFVVCVAAFLWSARRSSGRSTSRGRPPRAGRRRGRGARRRSLAGFRTLVASPRAPRRHRHVRRPGDGRRRTHRLRGRARDRRPPPGKRRRRLSRLRLRRRRASWAESQRSGWPAHRRLAAAFAAGVLAWGVGVALLGVTTSHRRRAGAPGRRRRRQHRRRRRGGDAPSAVGRRCRPRPRLRRARERAPVGARDRLDPGAARDPPARHPCRARRDRARPSRRRGRVLGASLVALDRPGSRDRRAGGAPAATPDLPLRSPRARWSSLRARSSRSTQSRAPR